MNPWIVANLWLIPALPLLASVAILLLGKGERTLAAADSAGETPAGRTGGTPVLRSHRRTAAALLAISGQIAALVLAITAFVPTLATPGWRAVHNFTWFSFGEHAVRLGFILDPLTAAMLVMITFVGLCIFVFSTGYMADDANYTRFFAYLSFFSAAMLGVVIANSLLLLFVCWELVGLASYLLIGFWIHKPSAAAAAKKAFITTRIGDIGLFLGILWLYGSSGTLLFYDDGNGCLEPAGLALIGASSTFIALLIFCGAVGKSGQFPLHVWLPDAMEGPTPVSALIHAATMVAAGVFLVARVFPIFSLGAIDGVTPALTVVVWVGVITALMAALIAIAQDDIKRILAYSTVSQLGLMMVSLGVGGVAAGIVHLLAHAFFKALLFLGAGSIIHGSHHDQDIRRMGGLRRLMPVTFVTYAIGMMSLSGVPLFFSGAWSKEEVLHNTAHWPASHVPHYLLMLGVVLTALYMTRQMIYVFFGAPRAGGHVHESPRVMTFPLIALAICSIGLSVILTPGWPWLHDYLSGRTAEFQLARIVQPMLFISAALVAAGVLLGVVIYRGAGAADPFAQRQPALFGFLANRMWLDELYHHTVLRWSAWTALFAAWTDRHVWDRIVRGAGSLGELAGTLSMGFDNRAINAGVDESATGTRGAGRLVSGWHSGRVQLYLRAVAVGTMALLLLYVWLA
ncbi:MAG: NADH-quinone oxidoreductase subunit L [Chthoniobacterales bacterium]|nr:NADH-quinone oxidoreductase subunit L [Chthoniobacterales bacterium]